MNDSKRWIAALVLVGAAAGAARAQSTWYVDLNGTPPGSGSQADPYTSIQYAIAQASTGLGDTILVLPGTYAETIDDLDKHLTIRGTDGPLATVIEAVPGSDAAVTMGAIESRLEGFTVSRTNASPGEAGVSIEHGTDAYLVRCILRGHDLGIENGYDAFVEECTITQNRVGIYGPFDALDIVSNSIVHGNTQWDVQNLFGTSFLSYSDVGSTSGAIADDTGSFDADPSFWDAPGGDLHPRADSPCIDTGDPADPMDPDGSRIDVGALTFDPSHAPGTDRYCFGDALLCPCGNAGSGDAGCDVAQATGGIALAVQSFLPNGSGGGTAALVGSGYPPAAMPGVTLIRGGGPQTPPVVFGDGLRCIALPTVRINAVLASGGTSLNPVTHGAGAGTFHYQVWVRNQPAGFCTPDAFNLSNAVAITW